MSSTKKIIALLPFKNEAWVLPAYIKSVQPLCDAIIGLDDGSTDQSCQILENAGATVYHMEKGAMVDLSMRRKKLLTLGRSAGGSHFIWLDADELFSDTFVKNGKKHIESLQPGERLRMKWVTLWKNPTTERVDNPLGNNYKDFIVCDDPRLDFKQQIVSESRTPQSIYSKDIDLPPDEGVVLHLQAVRWNMYQIKQAWYRMIEFIEGKRGAARINTTYEYTLDTPAVECRPLPAQFRSSAIDTVNFADQDFHAQQIMALFKKYGVKYFEPLQMWHIPAFHDQFVQALGREPHPQVFPQWLKTLNKIRHRLL